MKPATLERKIDALYGLPLEQFIGERDALAKELRAGGDAEAARRVKGLAKPSAPAWMANQVFWHARRSFNRLMQTGEELRRIQQGSPGPDALREAVGKRGVAMEAVRRELEERVYPDGKAPPPAMLRRIEGTLEAMAALGPDALDPPPGRLSTEIEPPGFGVLFPLLPGRTATTPARPKSSKTTNRKRVAQEKAMTAARARLLRADNELELREAAVSRADSDRSRCAEESRRARDEEKQSRQRLELARKRVRKTAVDLERSGKELQRAKAAARRAKNKRDEAHKAEKAAQTHR